MSAPAGEVRRLEDVGGRAWPARTSLRGPGWEIRFGDGLHRRRNSASVWPEAPLGVDHAASAVAGWYRPRGRRPVFKMTSASLPGLDDHLDAAGWESVVPTVVMTRGIRAGRPGATVEIGPVSGTWLDLFCAVSNYDAARRSILERLLASIRPKTGFALARQGGRPAGVGMVVVDDDHAGLFEIATDPAHRGKGIAQRIVSGLIGWAGSQGARTAYLQVTEDNTVARRLYGRLGFEDRYTYWYRIAPNPPKG